MYAKGELKVVIFDMYDPAMTHPNTQRLFELSKSKFNTKNPLINLIYNYLSDIKSWFLNLTLNTNE